MPEPAFIIEGEMEKRIIQTLCPGRPVRRIGCNGDGVKISVVAKFIDVQIRLLKNFHPIVVIFDRERRKEGCPALMNDLSLELDKLGHNGRYVLGMPDRTIENWILADWESVRKKYPEYKVSKSSSEQKHGKSELKKLLPKGTIFSEAALGPELFCLVSPEIVYINSVSFHNFVDALNIRCNWLKSIHDRFSSSK